jgi:hypothetical protein
MFIEAEGEKNSLSSGAQCPYNEQRISLTRNSLVLSRLQTAFPEGTSPAVYGWVKQRCSSQPVSTGLQERL